MSLPSKQSPLPRVTTYAMTERPTFRKLLEEDCLLGGEVHPSIADRLARIRELPVTAVGNLLRVERDEQGIWLVWQFIPGKTLEAFAAEHPPAEALRKVLGEVKRIIRSMHAHGIIHGALHPRNVIIDETGRVHLTHVSPLLWTDLAADEHAIGELEAAFGEPVNHASEAKQDALDQEAQRHRRAAYAAAAGAALLGIVMFVAILWYIRA